MLIHFPTSVTFTIHRYLLFTYSTSVLLSLLMIGIYLIGYSPAYTGPHSYTLCEFSTRICWTDFSFLRLAYLLLVLTTYCRSCRYLFLLTPISISYIPSDKLANLKCLSISLIIAYPCPKTCMPWVISIIWALASNY